MRQWLIGTVLLNRVVVTVKRGGEAEEEDGGGSEEAGEEVRMEGRMYGRRPNKLLINTELLGSLFGVLQACGFDTFSSSHLRLL